MRVEDFDYVLPEDRIAQDPIEPRDASRLLILERSSGAIRHSIFNQIGKELRAGDMLVVNDTRVLPARLYAQKETGAVIELRCLNRWVWIFGSVWLNLGKRRSQGQNCAFLFHNCALRSSIMRKMAAGCLNLSMTVTFTPFLSRWEPCRCPLILKRPWRIRTAISRYMHGGRGSAAPLQLACILPSV